MQSPEVTIAISKLIDINHRYANIIMEKDIMIATLIDRIQDLEHEVKMLKSWVFKDNKSN